MKRKIKFEEMRHPEIEELIKKDGMVIIPIGACEEHGRHLPVITDTKMAYQLAIDAAGLVSRKIPIAVLPAVWFGYTVSTLKNWPGTITIKPEVLIELMYEICKSLIDMGLEKIMILNGHGNNPGVLDVVSRKIGDDFSIPVGLVNIFSLWDKDLVNRLRKSKEGGIGHAGEIETSVMLYLDEELVDMNLADDTDIMKSKLKYTPVDFASNRKKVMYLSTWLIENSTYGGAGDPSDARMDFGKKIHDSSVTVLLKVIEEFYNFQLEYRNRKK
jgi:creatinine amidohydrolase